MLDYSKDYNDLPLSPEDECLECGQGTMKPVYFWKHGKKVGLTDTAECDNCEFKEDGVEWLEEVLPE